MTHIHKTHATMRRPLYYCFDCNVCLLLFVVLVVGGGIIPIIVAKGEEEEYHHTTSTNSINNVIKKNDRHNDKEQGYYDLQQSCSSDNNNKNNNNKNNNNKNNNNNGGLLLTTTSSMMSLSTTSAGEENEEPNDDGGTSSSSSTTTTIRNNQQGGSTRCSPSTMTVVYFNVGGTKYQVSRSLLEQHPDTMLSRMASSEMWKTTTATKPEEEEEEEGPIFIERDGERFRYVLDYMRDGNIVFPFQGTSSSTTSGGGGVTKTSMLHELAYYGFVDVNPDSITTEFPTYQLPKIFATITDDYKAEVKALIQQRDETIMAIAAASIAHACCIRFMTTGMTSVSFSTIIYEKNYRNREKYRHHIENRLDFQVIDAARTTTVTIEALNKALSKYGLKAAHLRGSSFSFYTDNKKKGDDDSQETDICKFHVDGISSLQ